MNKMNKIIIGDSFKLCKKIRNQYDLVFLDPDYNKLDDVYKSIEISMDYLVKDGGCILCFMYPEDIPNGQHFRKPDQVCHWIKPLNSRNTKKKYSRFVEAICIWHGNYFNQSLNASTRTGIFTDTLIRKHKHPYRKPFSLVEKLILLHCPPGGRVIDLFGGTFVVDEVCRKHGIESLCIDKVDWRCV